MAECVECEEEYPDKRLELGYETCLDCGQRAAVHIANTRTKQKLAEIAPRAAAGIVKTNEEPDWDREFGFEGEEDGKDA